MPGAQEGGRMNPPGSDGKIAWTGTVLGVQPRIRLTRSYDERSHSYQGYVLRIAGTIGAESREFLVGVGEGAHQKHQFRAGDRVEGEGLPVEDPRTETVELYRVSGLHVFERGADGTPAPPPWQGVPPSLTVYRVRRCRRLDARTYEAKCRTCIWGCRMATEMIIDNWKPDRKKYRQEIFCYGPLSCALYRAGPTRKVPGRHGMTWEEADWLDKQEVSHRGPED